MTAAAPALPVLWKRSARARRLSLRLDAVRGVIVLTLPHRATLRQGEAFLAAHEGWIEATVAALPAAPRLQGGEVVQIGGQAVPILHEPNARRGAWLDDAGLHVSGDAEHTPRRVATFLKKLAVERLQTSLARWAALMDLHPVKVDFREVRSRWGSCTRAGRVMLSWRLVMAPADVSDYVIIHELAHLRHFDHSENFWRLVDGFYPGGRPRRLAAERWLRENGTALLRTA